MKRFFNHFKNLFNSQNVFSNDDVEQCIKSDDVILQQVDMLDEEITIEEVSKAISSLNRNKSGGYDLLLPEIFIECNELLSPILSKTFNHTFTSGSYSTSWNKAIIVPVPKKRGSQ
jgi:hypothetical protein